MRKLLFLLVLASGMLVAQPNNSNKQTIGKYLQLAKVPLGVKSDSVLIRGSDKIVKFIPRSSFFVNQNLQSVMNSGSNATVATDISIQTQGNGGLEISAASGVILNGQSKPLYIGAQGNNISMSNDQFKLTNSSGGSIDLNHSTNGLELNAQSKKISLFGGSGGIIADGQSGKITLKTNITNGVELITPSSSIPFGLFSPSGVNLTSYQNEFQLIGNPGNQPFTISSPYGLTLTCGGSLLNLKGVTINSGQQITASSFIKSGGLSTQCLMADGSVSTFSGLSLTGNQSFSGIKSATNTGTTFTNGLNLTNNGTTSSTRAINITNTAGGYGLNVDNTGVVGVRVTNSDTSNIGEIGAQIVSSGADAQMYGLNIASYSAANGLLFSSTSTDSGYNILDKEGSVIKFSLDKSGNLFTNSIVTKLYTVSTLPTVVPTGALATVSDALSPTYMSTVVGGGNVVCPVFYNGNVWIAH